MPSETLHLRIALACVIGLTALRLISSALTGLELYGDEAQYWSWAQTLDFGYFTKPPLIAWIIAATTAVCGDGEACVRVSSPLLHAGTALALYGLGRAVADSRVAMWSAILWITLPSIAFSSLIVSTDVPLLFCWALAIAAYRRALDTRSWNWVVLTGLAIGFGLLAKYAMAYFVIGMVLGCGLFREHRWFLISPYIFGVSLPAGLLIIPNLAWNMENGWATVAHVGQNANLGGPLFHLDEAAAFLGEQTGVFGPILLAVLAWRIVQLIRGRADRREAWLSCFCLPVLLIVTIQAFLSRANANWAATAYVSATILVAGWAVTNARLWLAKTSVGLHVAAALIVGVFFLDLPGLEPPLKSDPLRRMRAWPETAAPIIRAMERDPERILLTDDRKTMASLLYQLRDTPFRPLMWDYNDHPDHHYELTARYNPSPGDRVLLVAKWDNPHPILKRFENHIRLPAIEVPIGADRVRVLHLFTLDGHVTP